MSSTQTSEQPTSGDSVSESTAAILSEQTDAPFNPARAAYMLAVQRYSDDFDRLCEARHAMGAEKYGEVKFDEVDTLQMAMEEVADLANYSRYSYIKLCLLQEWLTKQGAPVEVVGMPWTTVKDGEFISYKK